MRKFEYVRILIKGLIDKDIPYFTKKYFSRTVLGTERTSVNLLN